MKTLVLANQKGGVGKSAVASQLAYFFHLLMGKKVLVIDFDHQRNLSKSLQTGELVTVADFSASKVLEGKASSVEHSDFVLVPADNENLLKMERQADRHNAFATNLNSFLSSCDGYFDICIIDTNPNPDIRQLASLVVADYALSPIQLNQEAIDGIGDLLNHPTVGVRRIKETINPDLELLGILPNLVEPTPFQRDNFKALIEHYSGLLIGLKTGGYAAIKKSTAVAEAQAEGLPVWKMTKTSARTCWANLKPSFEQVAVNMGVK